MKHASERNLNNFNSAFPCARVRVNLAVNRLSPMGALEVERMFHSEHPGLCTAYKEMATVSSVPFPMQSLGVNGSICFCIEP